MNSIEQGDCHFEYQEEPVPENEQVLSSEKKHGSDQTF